MSISSRGAKAGGSNGGRMFGRRGGLALAQPGPDEAAPFDDRVGPRPDLFHQAAAFGLGAHGDALAVHIVFPAVIQAAQAALLVAAEQQGGSPVRAFLVEQAEPPVAVAEGDHALAERLDQQGGAVGLGDLLDQADRRPVLAHQPAHRGVALHPGQQVVFFCRQHGAVNMGRSTWRCRKRWIR